MEAPAASEELLQLHRLGARGQRGGQPQRRPDRHEQHGALAGAAARLLLLRMTAARGDVARHAAATHHGTLTCQQCPFPVSNYHHEGRVNTLDIKRSPPTPNTASELATFLYVMYLLNLIYCSHIPVNFRMIFIINFRIIG